MSIDVRQVSRRFGQFQALSDVSLAMPSGELTALLGPSGCGKTTLLCIIAGLETADSGSIYFSGVDTTDRHVRERQVGFVFQLYALFRHMTVFENVAFGLRVKPLRSRPSEAQIQEKVQALLALVQLDGLGDRYPSQLSGGQRQRIALARALAVDPKVLLLDEPFGALDAQVRKELRRWLRRLHEDLNVTSIFVTHDQEEALEVADRVVLMNAGCIEQVGTPQAVWDHPASPFVYGFLGDVNLFHGRAHAGQMQIGAQGEGLYLRTQEAGLSGPARAYVRPHDLQVQRDTAGAPGLRAKLERAVLIGPLARLELLRADGSGGDELVEAHLSADAYQQLGVQAGDMLVLTPRQARVFVDRGLPA